MKKQMICITGNVSSGKSATAKEIANALSWKLYKASVAFREKARELNMNIVDFCKYVEENPEIDKSIELKTKEIADDVGLGRTSVNGILQELKRDGYLQSDGEHRGRYVLTIKAIVLVKHMQKTESIMMNF